MISAFPKIQQLGTRHTQDIFKNEVEITEKIDGSQISFGRVDGNLYIRSKGAQLFPEACQKMFLGAVSHIIDIQDRIPDNTIFYGENLQKPNHNVLAYERVPKNHIILFGVSDQYKNFSQDYRKWADTLDIEAVPIISTGKIDGINDFTEILNTDSVLGNVKIEGVVIKNYERSYMIGDVLVDITCAKYVSEKFKEKHKVEWNREHSNKSKFEQYKESFRTEARWQKAVQHLRDAGELENEPRDIGKLIKEIQNDIIAEEIDGIKIVLWNLFKNDMLRKAIAGAPEWYKEQLLKESFSEE